jgi:hypothetical protein
MGPVSQDCTEFSEEETLKRIGEYLGKCLKGLGCQKHKKPAMSVKTCVNVSLQKIVLVIKIILMVQSFFFWGKIVCNHSIQI